MQGRQDALPFDQPKDERGYDNLRPIPLYAFETDEGAAIEAVAWDGSIVLWMTGDKYPAPTGVVSIPAHEKTGKLPAKTRVALGYRCSHVNPRTGNQCNTAVVTVGDSCRQHRPERFVDGRESCCSDHWSEPEQ